MTAIVISVALLLFAARLRMLRRVWRLPLKNGQSFFLAHEVGPDFYRSAGAPLFRRYHVSVLVPVLLDGPLAAWLFLTKRYVDLELEQVLALVVSILAYNLMLAHFSSLAASLSLEPGKPQTTRLRLSMAPRRLRDYTTPAIEWVIGGATLLALAMLGRCYALSLTANANHFSFAAVRGGKVLTVWVLYWQLGFLLLKILFIRRRMPLPAKRTEDFRRWRMAWLTHKLRIFDAVRLFCALSMLLGMTWITYGRGWPRRGQIILLGLAALALLLYLVYVAREERRLAATEKELKPVEMVKEFPRFPVAEGRYFAGGLLYFNRDNPWVVVRSVKGVALNMAHSTTHIAAAYLTGLVILAISMARLAR